MGASWGKIGEKLREDRGEHTGGKVREEVWEDPGGKMGWRWRRTYGST